MASSSVKFTWCACRNYKIQSKDTHEKCLLCLGIQHAKEAVLEYGKCPHCAKMDWSTCIKRLTKVQEVIHQEAQQRKNEAAQTGVVPKLEAATLPSAISEFRPPKISAAVPTTTRAEIATPAPSSSTVPVMFTILSPSPGLSEPNAGVVKGTYVSRLALQHTSDPAPPAEHLKPPTTPSTSHKRRRSSRCDACRTRHVGRSHGRRRKRSPSPPPSCSSWSSSDSSSSSCESAKEKKTRRESRKSAKLERRHGRLLEMVQQKLEAQQRAVQFQWSMLERRMDVLERRGSGAALSPTCPNAVESSQVFSSSQEGQVRRALDPVVSECAAPSVVVKQEERPVGVSSATRSGLPLDGEGEGDSQPPMNEVAAQEVLTSNELQNLIGRAARYLGIGSSKSPTSSDPPHPVMAPEFEELVQSTWSNPSSAKPFRTVFSELYKLHECQSSAYDHMPQVNSFMSAIFQAVRPTESREQSFPADRWKFTEALVEKTYQTAGMLAKTANYLRYLSDYQKRLLVEISEDQPQRLTAILCELKLIGQFTFQLSSHQAELSGRIMAASVAVRRQVWMAKANYTDSLKATVADLPFVVSLSAGENTASSSGDAVCRQET